jgi:hypothetical protein
MNNFYCEDPLCLDGAVLNVLNARVRNSIIIGSSTDELWIVDADPQAGFTNIVMQNNIVVVDELLDAENFPDFFTSICTNCFEWMHGDTLFVDMNKFDFHLDTSSIAEKKALPIPGITDDLDGFSRDAVLPDIGCYEFRD